MWPFHAKSQRPIFLYPYPLRTIAKRFIQRFELGSYENRIRIGAVDRPPYAYIVYNAAVLARKLGYKRISVLEFGVAGGNGLVNLENHAQQVAKLCSVDIDIYGFDNADGLPEPLDYRDHPNLWKKGFLRWMSPNFKQE